MSARARRRTARNHLSAACRECAADGRAEVAGQANVFGGSAATLGKTPPYDTPRHVPPALRVAVNRLKAMAGARSLRRAGPPPQTARACGRPLQGLCRDALDERCEQLCDVRNSDLLALLERTTRMAEAAHEACLWRAWHSPEAPGGLTLVDRLCIESAAACAVLQHRKASGTYHTQVRAHGRRLAPCAR